MIHKMRQYKRQELKTLKVLHKPYQLKQEHEMVFFLKYDFESLKELGLTKYISA